MQSQTSAIILAGGRGERLAGQDKAVLLLDGETLLERAYRRVAALADDVVIVLRPDQELAPPLVAALSRAVIVHDLPGYTGVLAGMAAGLEAAQHEWSLLVACDMPFVQASLVRYMWSLREGSDVVVPRLEVGLEPLHALYHRRCLSALHDALAQKRRRVISFYEPLQVRYVDEGEIARFDPRRLSFFNINTPEDLVCAQELLADDA
jgi:molybdopterin-guanine dinucleotide biosynthesis protein A